MTTRTLWIGCGIALLLATATGLGAEDRLTVKTYRIPRKKYAITHYVTAETEFYSTSPQQGRPPDGKLVAGLRVALLSSAGSYAQVQIPSGQDAWVAQASLTRLLSGIKFTSEDAQRADAINEFGFDLYRRFATPTGNLVFSPASLASGLAMTSAGAAGETRAEILRVLHLDRLAAAAGAAAFHASFAKFAQVLDSGDGPGGYALHSANRIWADKSLRLLPEFLQVTRARYGADAAKVDFGQTADAVNAINAWIAGRTQNRIPAMLSADDLSGQTRLVLANAIDFQGNWKNEFEGSSTRDVAFNAAAGLRTPVPTMHQVSDFRYAATGNMQLLELPYGNAGISMLIFLPQDSASLLDSRNRLTALRLRSWIRTLRPRLVSVRLPKFHFDARAPLKGLLQELGIRLAFSPQAADFSAAARNDRVWISDVIHQAQMRVDETGTTAAAATVVELEKAAAGTPEDEGPQPVEFRADHPFLFLIRENKSGAILFLGLVNNPVG